MKKKYLIVGVINILLGAICFLIGAYTDFKISGPMFSLGGAGVASGMMLVLKHFYWSAHKNMDTYIEKIENETIERHDERNEKLRDKSGRYAYLIGLLTIGLSVMAFWALGQLGYLTEHKVIISYLCGYFIFQYVVGIIIFRYMKYKY